jgi:uncharacterized protein YecE (DUF72 family)
MESTRPGRVRVGCSGWQYRHWRGDFYPADLPQTVWLEHYARTFDTVEINNSFYRLPAAGVFGRWRARSPVAFCFAVKASRYLTHMRKLKEPADPLAVLFDRARELGRKLGPVLYQLPPGWHVDADRLAAFIRALPRRRRHAIEFRDASWYTDAVLALLEAHHLTLCLHDMPGSAIGPRRSGGFVYVRFHGSGARYGGGYPTAHLREWAGWLAGERDAGRDVYAYFNNDVGGHAPRDAQTLRALLAADV